MITKITGSLVRVLDEELRLQVGPIEYQILVPEGVRRNVQQLVGQDITLHTVQYLEGNINQGRLTPRLLGFTHETELEFFDLFCTVDKVGVRKAMKALARPIREIADAIHRQDAKWLTTLPGVGPTTAEQIVAKLKRGVAKFILGPVGEPTAPGAVPAPPHDVALFEDAYQALLSVGHNPQEARQRLDKVLTLGKKFDSVQELILAVYQQK